MIERHHPLLSVRAQCALLELSPSAFYYQPQALDAVDLLLMRLIDEQYTRTPFYGVRRMTWWLSQQGHTVNAKRVRRLMRLMNLEAIYPKPRLSQPGSGASVYPYLLHGLSIDRVDLVWATDITYIRLRRGFVYLCAVMDWATRYVLAWELSTTLDALFCLEALERSLAAGRVPVYFNSDQGTQFTCEEFAGRLLRRGIKISRDGRGRWLDNVFVERLWRTVKYEEVFLKDYADPREARKGLGNYFHFYNHERPHTALDNQPPAAVYFKAHQN